jgi:hypothetical protein
MIFCFICAPHQGILLFCLILLSFLTYGVFFRCKLSLLKQHIFLILTQPSWDGYLLLYSQKSSIRGTAPNMVILMYVLLYMHIYKVNRNDNLIKKSFNILLQEIVIFPFNKNYPKFYLKFS